MTDEWELEEVLPAQFVEGDAVASYDQQLQGALNSLRGAEGFHVSVLRPDGSVLVTMAVLANEGDELQRVEALALATREAADATLIRTVRRTIEEEGF